MIDYLTRPEQMLERAKVVGQFPTRTAVYDDPALRRPSPSRRRRPARSSSPPSPDRSPRSTPSSPRSCRSNLHRALSRQAEPAAALARAAAEMQGLLDRVGLGTGEPVARR